MAWGDDPDDAGGGFASSSETAETGGPGGYGGDPGADVGGGDADTYGTFMSTNPISGGTTPSVQDEEAGRYSHGVAKFDKDVASGGAGKLTESETDAYRKKGQYRSGLKGVGKALAPAITGAVVGSGPIGVVTGFFTGMYNQVKNAQMTVKEGVESGVYADKKAGWRSIREGGVADRAAVEGNVTHGRPSREEPFKPGLLTPDVTPDATLDATPDTAIVPLRYVEYMNSVPGAWEDYKAAQLENPGLKLVDWATEHATASNQVIV